MSLSHPSSKMCVQTLFLFICFSFALYFLYSIQVFTRFVYLYNMKYCSMCCYQIFDCTTDSNTKNNKKFPRSMWRPVHFIHLFSCSFVCCCFFFKCHFGVESTVVDKYRFIVCSIDILIWNSDILVRIFAVALFNLIFVVFYFVRELNWMCATHKNYFHIFSSAQSVKLCQRSYLDIYNYSTATTKNVIAFENCRYFSI